LPEPDALLPWFLYLSREIPFDGKKQIQFRRIVRIVAAARAVDEHPIVSNDAADGDQTIPKCAGQFLPQAQILVLYSSPAGAPRLCGDWYFSHPET
jgi:hypothetical protein